MYNLEISQESEFLSDFFFLVGFLLLAFVLPLARSRDPHLMQSYSNPFTFNSKMKDFTKSICANRISFFDYVM